MPYKKTPCPSCGEPKSARSKLCRACVKPYERTAEIRERLSASQRGRTRRRGYKRPEHSKAMKAYWTPERREAKRQEMLKRNPNARYHGLSARRAAEIVRDAGACSRCQGDGSVSRLGVHHRNRDKHDQRPENLEVLCHRCHMQEHARAGETGWDSYHRERRN